MDDVCVLGEVRDLFYLLSKRDGQLEAISDEPTQLIERNDQDTNNYLDNIRQFNNVFAFLLVQVNFVKFLEESLLL